MTAMTAGQAAAALDRITAWLRGRQDMVDMIEKIGGAQGTLLSTLDAQVPHRQRQAMRLAYCDHLWCTLDAALADQIAHGGECGRRVEDARRSAGRTPIPHHLVELAAHDVSDMVRFAVHPTPPPKKVPPALRILAALICPTPEGHAEVLSGALETIGGTA